MHRIIIFASGSGTNAENIIEYFRNSDFAVVSYVVTNNPKAGVIERARRLGIPSKIFSKQEINRPEFLDFLKNNADFIVLAGFLLKIPDQMIHDFPSSIINIHPALLPKYGGKGMYGKNVHKAVLESGDKKSGMTIHLVTKEYDKGKILQQEERLINENETVESLSRKINILEYLYYPGVIERYILRNS